MIQPFTARMLIQYTQGQNVFLAVKIKGKIEINSYDLQTFTVSQ